MRRTVVALGAALVLTAAAMPAHAASYYQVSLKRIDKDLYRETSSRLIIKTRYCYEYGSDAILVWDGPYSWENKLYFDGGGECEVAGIYR